MWGCGLKLVSNLVIKQPLNVTPYVGVWIEMLLRFWFLVRFSVTPYVGVWIEMVLINSSCPESLVTPYVGVWIEI